MQIAGFWTIVPLDIAEYNHPTRHAPELAKFAPLTQQDVLKTMNQLKSKSCELDTMLTHISKQIAPSIAGLITKIVNLSLGNGEFCRSWKMVVVRHGSGKTITKKAGLRANQPKFQTCQQSPLSLQGHRKVHALTSKPTLC